MPRVLKIILIALFAVICYFPIFLHLDSESLYHWDEARNGLNALEMAQNGNPIVRYYQGAPETWETKPPLLIWLQVISFKIVGYNELAIRLPSALAAIFTIFLIVRFFSKDLNDPLSGFLAGLVLVCSLGYIDFHVVRTGDHDALLAFFQTIIVIYAYKYLVLKPNQNKDLAILTVVMVLSILTKSIMGFAMIPGIFLYTFFRKQTLQLLKQRNLWLGILGFVIIIAGYYLLREQLQPGYFQLVWENELFPRYFNIAEGHNYKVPKSRFYYLKLIAEKQFTYFAYALPVLLIAIFLSKEKDLKSFAKYLIFCIIVFLALISGGTINSWYDAPVFPLLAMLVGLGLSIVIKTLFQNFKINFGGVKSIITGLLILGFFYYPYYKILEKVYHPNINQDKYGKFLEHLKKEGKLSKDIFVFYTYRNSSFLFYEKVYNEFKDWKIESCGVRGKFSNCELSPTTNQEVMICNQVFINEFETTYEFAILSEMDNCRLYKVEGLKGSLPKNN